MPPPPSIIRLTDLSSLSVFSHEAMATTFRFHLAPPTDGGSLRPIAEEAFRLLDRLEEKLSFYQEGSDITRINRAGAGETLRIDEITHRCLLIGMEVSAASGGAFDPFAGHAALLAKGQEIPHHLRDIPPPADHNSAPVIALHPDQPQVTKLDGQRWLDLGAIGKGAALDAVAALLQDWAVPTAVLSGGGSSILVFGAPPQPGMDQWELTLPQSPGSPTLSLDPPFALGASGEGFQPGHIIDPAGQPPRPQSLIKAPTAALADALSTAAVLLPDDKLRALLGDDPQFAVFATHATAPIICTGVFVTDAFPPPPEVSLVIPCWCESRRLPTFLPALCAAIKTHRLPVEIIVIDDDSPGQEPGKTAEHIESLRARFPFLQPMVSIDRHRGKGGAIIQAWGQSAPTSRWLAFVDADGAVPPEAVVSGIQQALAAAAPLPVIAANRYHHDADKPVHRAPIRQRTGRWFAGWARRQLQVDANDCQCGFKLVPAHWWRHANHPWQEEGYAFDLELLVTARGAGIPLTNLNISWQEIAGSHVSLSDGLRLIQAVRRWRRPPEDSAAAG